MTTVGNATLLGVPIMQTSTSGFARPSRVVQTPLLDDGTDADDQVVLQSSAKGIREAQIAFVTDDDDDVADLRDMKDSLVSGTYVDEAGTSWTVILAELTTTRSGHDLWDCTARLLVPPVVEGS